MILWFTDRKLIETPINTTINCCFVTWHLNHQWRKYSPHQPVSGLWVAFLLLPSVLKRFPEHCSLFSVAQMLVRLFRHTCKHLVFSIYTRGTCFNNNNKTHWVVTPCCLGLRRWCARAAGGVRAQPWRARGAGGTLPADAEARRDHTDL